MSKVAKIVPTTDILAAELRPSILRLGRQLRREALRMGSSAMDAQLLGTVMLYPGMGVSDLADLEQMSQPAMSAHVKRLLSLGLLQKEVRRPDQDRRHSGLLLTGKGAEHLRAISEKRNDWLAERISNLSDVDRAVLIRALKPLKQMLESGDQAE